MGLLHFEPGHGWMNDPNGLIHWKGRHHLFFQYNPESTRFENQHWGHASATDLMSWVEHPVALVPGDHGASDYDGDGCYSGCAVETDGGVTLLYTGVHGPEQLPCLARSEDDELLTFAKDPANPVIKHRPGPDVEVFRDHSVWRDGTRWHQAMAGSRHGIGTAFAYTSSDLRAWQDPRILLDGSQVAIPSGTWECPDVFSIGGTDALVVSVIHDELGLQPEVWWVTGEMREGRLEPTAHGPVDVGNRLYGPQSYWTTDGRRVMFGWIRTHLDPASQGAPSLGAMSLPRQLAVVDGELRIEPAEELQLARRRRHDFPLTHEGETTLRWGPRSAGELQLDTETAASIEAITLLGTDRSMTIDYTLFPGPGALTLYWDAGIVEVFRNGRAGVWSDLALEEVTHVRIEHHSGSVGVATVWSLSRPDPGVTSEYLAAAPQEGTGA